MLPTPPPGSIENVAIALGAIASLALIGRKFLPGTKASAEYVSKPEFHDLVERVDGLRDKIDARFVCLGEKIDRVGESLHTRLNELESGLARVDERTRK